MSAKVKNRFITTTAIAQAKDLRAYGFTWKECASLVGYKWPALRRAVLRAGGAASYQAVCPGAVAMAIELRATGMPWKLIGREVGQNYRTLKNCICRLNKGG